MIINTGARTDTPQYFSDWLLRRFQEGYVLVRNPFHPRQVTRYDLSPRVVDCVVFCSKNYAPILDRLPEITSRFNTYFFYTITAYGKDMEPGVPCVEESMDTLERLAALVGPSRIAWRYDPVLVDERYTVDVHREAFERMARRLAPHVGRCIFSFVELYGKVRRNMPQLAPVSEEDRDALLRSFSRTAQLCGLRLQACVDGVACDCYGIDRSGCISLEELGRANAVEFKRLSHRGSRPGCACFESRDIGAYDSCPNGCRYCYANSSARRAVRNFRTLHDPASPLLLGHLEEGDVVHQADQKSILAHPGMRQLFVC